MRRNLSGVHAANAAKKTKAAPKPPRAAPSAPARRKKPGPKPGRQAWEARQKRKVREDERAAFLPKFETFLGKLAKGATHRAAMDECGLDWPLISRHMCCDLGMQARYKAAKDMRDEWWKQEHLDEMHRRAVDGFKEPMVSAGKLVCEKTVYSDGNLLALVKAENPDKFAERSKSELNVNTSEELSKVIGEVEISIGLPSTAKPATETPSDKEPPAP